MSKSLLHNTNPFELCRNYTMATSYFSAYPSKRKTGVIHLYGLADIPRNIFFLIFVWLYPPSFKSSPDCSVFYLKNFGYFRWTQPSFGKSDAFFYIPFGMRMLFAMFFRRYYHKIFWSIVVPVPILMMDNFVTFEPSSDNFLHNSPMLKDTFAINDNFNIWADHSGASICRPTGAITKVIRINVALVTPYFGTARITSKDNNHGIHISQQAKRVNRLTKPMKVAA